MPTTEGGDGKLWRLDAQEKNQLRRRLGRKLRELRELRGLKQEEVAELLGTSQSLVSRTERGSHRLELWEVEAFARAYGTTLAAIGKGVIGAEPFTIGPKRPKRATRRKRGG